MDQAPHSEGEKGSRGEPAEDKQPPIPVSAIVLVAVGGMLLFMGFFFGLVASLGVGGFLIPALGILVAGSLMVLASYRIWKGTRVHLEEKAEKEKERLLCDYCGGRNTEGSLECQFCGAPLR
jgi:hypothetical protein